MCVCATVRCGIQRGHSFQSGIKQRARSRKANACQPFTRWFMQQIPYSVFNDRPQLKLLLENIEMFVRFHMYIHWPVQKANTFFGNIVRSHCWKSSNFCGQLTEFLFLRRKKKLTKRCCLLKYCKVMVAK